MGSLFTFNLHPQANITKLMTHNERLALKKAKAKWKAQGSKNPKGLANPFHQIQEIVALTFAKSEGKQLFSKKFKLAHRGFTVSNL